MGKLHEVIAVEPDLKQRATSLLQSLSQLFQRSGSFMGQSRIYTPIKDDGHKLPSENKEVELRVEDQLARARKDVGAWMDAALQKEITNAATNARLQIGDFPIDLPAPALLNLENKLAELRRVYAAIPTNDTAERWSFNLGEGLWVSEPTQTIRTSKKPEVLVKHPPTKEHPAQTEIVAVDVPEGTWATLKKSGMLSPTEKQARLDRIDHLALEVKKARQRANDVEAVNVKIAEKVFQYIDGK